VAAALRSLNPEDAIGTRAHRVNLRSLAQVIKIEQRDGRADRGTILGNHSSANDHRVEDRRQSEFESIHIPTAFKRDDRGLAPVSDTWVKTSVVWNPFAVPVMRVRWRSQVETQDVLAHFEIVKMKAAIGVCHWNEDRMRLTRGRYSLDFNHSVGYR